MTLQVAAMIDFFEIGVIVNTQGLKGEVRIYPRTDDIRRFGLLKSLSLVLPNGKNAEYEIEGIRYHKNLVLAKLVGINDASAAELLRGSTIVLAREDALPLAEGEYYYGDLIGLSVFDEDGLLLGELIDVLFTGANDVYVVKRLQGKDLLIPAIADCNIQVDLDTSRMTVKLLEGLLDL